MEVWLLWLTCVLFILSKVRCFEEMTVRFEEPELFDEIRISLIQTLKEIDTFLKREENKELRKLRQIHRWRLFHKNLTALNNSIVNHEYLEYNKQLGIVCPKKMNVARKSQCRYEVESLSNVNFEIILNTLQRLQEFVNLTLQSTTPKPWTRATFVHPVFDDPQFQRDIISQKKFDLVKYIEGKWKPKQMMTTRSKVSKQNAHNMTPRITRRITKRHK
uniref:Interleukin-6 n=1 Tax=Cacopsylla melanoneura TaxID=428564 RepID=A0A8D8RQB7_9HEMI